MQSETVNKPISASKYGCHLDNFTVGYVSVKILEPAPNLVTSEEQQNVGAAGMLALLTLPNHSPS